MNAYSFGTLPFFIEYKARIIFRSRQDGHIFVKKCFSLLELISKALKMSEIRGMWVMDKMENDLISRAGVL
jgi:hypothetical protein